MEFLQPKGGIHPRVAVRQGYPLLHFRGNARFCRNDAAGSGVSWFLQKCAAPARHGAH